MASNTKVTRKPRARLADPPPLELMESFLNEFVRYSKSSLENAADKGIRRQLLGGPLIPRSDGLGFPVSGEANRIARRLGAAERASSADASARFSASTYELLSMIALGDTISHLKEQAAAVDAKIDTTEKVLAFYRSTLEGQLARVTMDLYPHIPCHMFHSHGVTTDFAVGPIHFFTRDAWAERYIADDNIRAEVRRAWTQGSQPSGSQQLPPLEQLQVNSILNTIGNHRWVGTVLIRDHDADNSHAKANVLVGLALDSLSVVLAAPDGVLLNRAGNTFFRGGSRLATTTDRKIVSGSSARLPGLGGRPEMADQFLAETAKFREAVGHILTAYADAHQSGEDAPWLIERWVNALHWFGEARRESSNFMAVVKYGCALDILSGAGGNVGKISRYIEVALGVAEATDQAGKPLSVSALVNNVFNDGRSALAHGEAFGLLTDRSADRIRADIIVQQVIQRVTEPLGTIVQQKDRMLTINKDAQLRAFQARLASLSGTATSVTSKKKVNQGSRTKLAFLSHKLGSKESSLQ